MSRSQSECFLGVDIGGTKINIAIVDESGKILASSSAKTPKDVLPARIIERVCAETEVLLRQQGTRADMLPYIGIGVPGTVDARGTVAFAPNLGWTGVPISAEVQKHFDIPILVAQDTRAAAVGEFVAGAGQGMQSIVCVTIGTGIGCGMILNGKLYHGTNNACGELGHMLSVIDGKNCACGKRGCLEAYASGTALRAAAEEVISEARPNAALSKEKPSAELVFQWAVKNNERAKKALDETVMYLGVALTNVANLLAPDAIFISGGMSDQEELLIQPLRQFIQTHAYRLTAEQIIVERAILGQNAPVVGAALLAKAI